VFIFSFRGDQQASLATQSRRILQIFDNSWNGVKFI
jgi:hypothetical protein